MEIFAGAHITFLTEKEMREWLNYMGCRVYKTGSVMQNGKAIACWTEEPADKFLPFHVNFF